VIARIWRGWTRSEDAESYADYIEMTGLAEYAATPGNRGAWLLHRLDGDRAEFLAVSLWESRDSIATFAGEDIETAVFYPEDDRFLIDRETKSVHYEVTLPPDADD